MGDGTLSLVCQSAGLDDSKASTILDSFLDADIGSLSGLDFYNNSLTKIPEQIKPFSLLKDIYLSSNQLRVISADSFHFDAALEVLYLSDNPLTTIEPEAFQGNIGNGSHIVLQETQLTRFEASVFQVILEQMEPYGGFPNAWIDVLDNPIDCVTDHCHLAWLIGDSRQLIKDVYEASCSNGISFQDLDPKDFEDCRIDTTETTEITTEIPSSTTGSGGPTCMTKKLQLEFVWILIVSTVIIFASRFHT